MISVIVPCYNSGKTLKKCVTSIRNQSFPDFEIVLVNDGSTDNTLEVCNNLRLEDNRIKVISQENKGLMAAWKKGVCIAEGDEIAFVDSDDWIEQDMLWHMHNDMCQKEVELVIYGLTAEYEDGKKVTSRILAEKKIYKKEDIQGEILPVLFHTSGMESRAIPMSRCGKLFKKQLLFMVWEQLDETISVGEDDLTTFLVINNCNSMFCNPEYCPYHYMRNDDSMIGKYDSELYLKNMKLKNALLDAAKRCGYLWVDQIEIQFYENIIMCIKKATHRNKEDSIHNIREYILNILCMPDVSYALETTFKKVKGYGIKEKIFTLLLKKKWIYCCICVTRLLQNIHVGAR